MATIDLPPEAVSCINLWLLNEAPMLRYVEHWLKEVDAEAAWLLYKVTGEWCMLSHAEWYENLHFMFLILLEASED